MSDFPRLKYMLDDSSCEPLSGHETVRATNGALHVRRLFSSDKRNWILSFLLDNTDLSTLMTHYGANKDASFNFYWPGDAQTYSVSYSAAPQPSRVGPLHSRVRVTLMER